MSLPPPSSSDTGSVDTGPADTSPSADDGKQVGAATSPLVALAEAVEQATALDPLVDAVRPVADALVADPFRRDLLRGAWVGHAIHPPLTDLPIGFWSSAVVLDLVGGRRARPAAQRLVALGVLTALPAAVSGWAEWSGTSRASQRVGVVHAASNVVALGLFARSWRVRRAGKHWRGAALGLVASSALGAGAFFGGHLANARHVSSRHPAFED